MSAQVLSHFFLTDPLHEQYSQACEMDSFVFHSDVCEECLLVHGIGVPLPAVHRALSGGVRTNQVADLCQSHDGTGLSLAKPCAHLAADQGRDNEVRGSSGCFVGCYR